MPIPDKVAAARKIESLLKATIAAGTFKLKYRITVDPPMAEERLGRLAGSERNRERPHLHPRLPAFRRTNWRGS